MCTSCGRCPSGSSRGSCAAPRRCGSETRCSGTLRSARWCRASSSSSSANWSMTPSRRGRRCSAAGRSRRPRGPQWRLLRADRPHRRHPRDADHARGDLRAGAAVVVVDSEDQALALANDSEFGLGASVWTADRSKGERIARELESGMVWINDHMFSHGACQCSWGGVKSSGLGARTRSSASTNASTSSCGCGSPRGAQPLVAPLRRDAGQSAQADRRGALRPALDPGRGAARRAPRRC